MDRLYAGFRYDMVVFDVGGTLLGFHEAAPFREFLEQAGLPASEEEVRRFHRRLISVIVDQRDAAQGQGAKGAELDAWWRGNFAKTWPDRPDLAEKMFGWLTAGRFDRLFPDAVPALIALRDVGMPMAVLSNWGTHLHDVLRRFGLAGCFEFITVSAEVGLAKPDRRIFDLVVAQANRPRQRLLYVGDHIGDDIEGARGAGLDAVLIDRRDQQAGALCPRIRSLLELVDYVRPPTRPAQGILLDMDGVVLASPPLHPRPPTFVPGMVPLLHDLRGRGVRLGLVTGSACRVVDESLAPSGVAALFDVLVTGDDVSHGKPDPEPYLIATARLGLPPEACLAIENAPLGIRSARAAGMACVALETTLPAAQLAEAGAARVFPGAGALRTWLLYG
jgi:HAD superfamily hydrolase (TIGR01509 family)